MSVKKKIAVFLGGKSPEHDVSIVSGLQAMGAIDPDLFDAFPVYVTPKGEFYVGDALRERNFYVPSAADLAKLDKVALHVGAGGAPALIGGAQGFLQKAKAYPFDAAIPAFHGLFGEDGRMQGVFEIAGAAYTGMRAFASTLFMDKGATKRFLAGSGIPMLPFTIIARPSQGLLILPDELKARYTDISFPAIVKPNSLGSSIGVAKVDDWQELSDVLPGVFRLDEAAIVEPFVPNLVEYNVSVCGFGGRTRTSAIERPKHASELLDFRAKYLSSEGSKKTGGVKSPGQSASEGMLSLTRDINPELPGTLSSDIAGWAKTAFELARGTGAPRIDFLCNSVTGEVWLNEINPCPGSFAYFLWEAAEEPMLFAELMENLIAEGEAEMRRMRLPLDPTPEDARLFKRK